MAKKDFATEAHNKGEPYPSKRRKRDSTSCIISDKFFKEEPNPPKKSPREKGEEAYRKGWNNNQGQKK